jgi:hypothetical protein
MEDRPAASMLTPFLPVMAAGLVVASTLLGRPLPVHATQGGDTQPPNVWHSPSDSILTRDSVTVGVGTWDDVGVVRVDYELDGVDVGSSTAAGAFEVTIDLTSFDPGPHQLHARAWDAAGNSESTAAARGISIDRTDPSVRDPQLHSTSHALGAWSSDPTIDVAFGGITYDNGYQGYWYGWSTNGAAMDLSSAWVDNGLAAAYTSPALADGSYWFLVRPVDQVGNTRTYATGPFRIDRTVPRSATSPLPVFVPGTAAGTAFVVSWSGTDFGGAGIASWDVRSRSAASGRPFGSPRSWTSGTTARSKAFAAVDGTSTCFSSRARDRAGNVSAWSPERCTIAALDDRAFAPSAGWTRNVSADGRYFRGTWSRTTTRGARLTRSGVAGLRFALMATRCPTCGTVEVRLGSTLLGRVSLATTNGTTLRRALLPLATIAATTAQTLTVTVSSSGKPVEIDGVWAGRA